MSVWRRLLTALGFRQGEAGSEEARYEVEVILPEADTPPALRLNGRLARELQDLANRQQRSQGEVAADLIAAALAQRSVTEDIIRRWQTLSAREQQVARLVLTDMTYSQIGQELSISPETVKVHMRNILQKFDLRSRTQLILLLRNLDLGGRSDPAP